MTESSNSVSFFGDRPREINVVDFVQQRALEISDLMSVVDNADLPAGEVARGPRTFIQRLPRHMRRRAMSYNLKRLPWRRRRTVREIVGEHKHRKKPPSRFYRRRPGNLLKAYLNRRRKLKWLETHIWHAKRFRVTDQFGWKIPDRSCQRGFRAAYRDSARHCTIQDVSYYSCLELTGPESTLIGNLNQMCSPDVGLSFKSKMFLNGSTEGNAVLYEPGKYPYGCLGRVSFLWNPNSNGACRQLWIWAHPCLETQLLQQLVNVFQLGKHSNGSTKAEKEPAVAADSYVNNNLDVKLIVLNDHLLRFRLKGPASTSILKETFAQPDFNRVKSTFSNCGEQARAWDLWKTVYSNLEPGAVQSGRVISLVVEDPRLRTEYRKTIPEVKSASCKGQPEFDDLAKSLLWLEHTRHDMQQMKTSDSDINKIRSKYSSLQLKTLDYSILDPNLVPIILCQQPGNNANLHFGAGWDVILPATWGMPFWLAFQCRTARAVGLQVEQHTDFEAGLLNFPLAWPDTESGKQFSEQRAKQMEVKYLARPYNRRIKYTSLKIKYPFNPDWLELTNGWQATENICKDYFVLRNRKLLTLLNNAVKNRKPLDAELWRQKLNFNSLVAVRISSLGKGIPKLNSLICLPTSEDLKTIKNFILHEQCKPKITPIGDSTAVREQTSAFDPTMDFLSFQENVGKEVDLNVLFADKSREKLLHRKAKEKERKKLKRLGVKRSSTTLKDDLNEQEFQTTNVVQSCCRSVMGFVVSGDYSFRLGKGVGLGFCSFVSLECYLRLIQNEASLGLDRPILFRNTNSWLYRSANIEILL